MDPATLAATATSLLAPYLVKAGKRLIDDAAKQLPDTVGTLWDKISEKFQSKPAAQEAANDLESKPESEANQDVFKAQLRKLLEEDPGFAREFELLVNKAQASEHITNTGSGAVATHGGVAAGQGGVAIGGNMEGGNIVVGNNNSIEGKRKKNK